MARQSSSRVGALVGFCALIAAVSTGFAAGPEETPGAVQPDGAASGAVIGQLGWMAGGWIRQSEAGRMEEHWLAPGGGMMLGLHRDVFASGDAAFEYLRIEEDSAGLVYLASPGGRPATPFRLVELGEHRAVFANPDHDFPQRIIYRREGDTLHARIEGDTPSGHSFREWEFIRKSRLRKDAPGK